MGRHKRRRTNVTLKEKLSEIPNGSIVKIGSKNCFLYAYYKNDLTEQRLLDIDTQNLKQLNHLILRSQIKGNERLFKSYMAKLQRYKPLLERYVKRCFQTDIEDNTYIIYITGTETGSYWCIEEYAYYNKLFLKECDKHYDIERLNGGKLKYAF